MVKLIYKDTFNFEYSLEFSTRPEKSIGDNFHQIVIENKEAIMKKFKHITHIKSLDKIEDSIKLG